MSEGAGSSGSSTPTITTPPSSVPASPTVPPVSLKEVSEEAKEEAAKIKAEANAAFKGAFLAYTCARIFFAKLWMDHLQSTNSMTRRCYTPRPSSRIQGMLRYGPTVPSRE